MLSEITLIFLGVHLGVFNNGMLVVLEMRAETYIASMWTCPSNYCVCLGFLIPVMTNLKGIVYPKFKNMSSFTHPHVHPKL